MTKWTLLAVVVALGGCGDSKKKEEPAADPTPKGVPILKKQPERQPTGTPNPQPELQVTVDGAPLAIQAALAIPTEDGGWELTMSSVPLTCEEISGNGRTYYKDEVAFRATVGKLLEGSGAWVWRTRETYFSGSSTAGASSASEVVDGEKLQATLALELESAAFRDEPKKKLVAKGKVSAVKCPPRPADADAPAKAPAPPAQAATMEVAGQKVPIVGARLEVRDDGQVIELASGPLRCGEVDINDLEVTLRYKGAELWQADVNGRWIGNQNSTQIFDKGKLTAKVKLGEGDSTPADIELGGSTMIMEYPVALSGKVKAERCAK